MEGGLVKDIKEGLAKLKSKAKQLKKNIYLLYLAYKHPKTPWYAKVLAAGIVTYALSPIDLIPDFIPVLGYLDDLILVPAGIALAIKLIPAEVLEECRRVEKTEDLRKKGIAGAILITLIWILIAFIIIRNFI